MLIAGKVVSLIKTGPRPKLTAISLLVSANCNAFYQKKELIIVSLLRLESASYLKVSFRLSDS